jgi:hypothetical protein
MRYNYLIIFFFVVFFIELPLLYVYYTGQEKVIKKDIKQIEFSDTFFISSDNPRYFNIPLEGKKIYQILLSSSSKIDISLTDSSGFLMWQKDPESLRPLEFFYQIDKLDFPFVPKETKVYYFIFETEPLLATNTSVNIEVSSTYKEVIREDILNVIRPALKVTSVITAVLFILSILPKGGFKKKKFKNIYMLSKEGKSFDIAYLREAGEFSEKEINVIQVMHMKGQVTEKEIPKLFDISAFYKLYKMGFIEKITEL